MPLPLEETKRLVQKDEWIELTAEDWKWNPTVHIKFPSGFDESIPLEIFLKLQRLQPGSNEERHLISYLSSWKQIAIQPSTRTMKIRVTDPNNPTQQIYV